MADDVDPNQSPNTDTHTHSTPEPSETSEASNGGRTESVDIAMVEVELVELERREPELERRESELERREPEGDSEFQTPEPLPSMSDLDQVASELDDIDARLASLDEQRP